MEFCLNADQELLRQSTARFLDKHRPLHAIRPLLEADDVVDRGVWRQGAELGWTAMLVAPEHGGGSVTDQPLIDLVALEEALGAVLYSGPVIPTNVVADALERCASPELFADLLVAIASGERLAAWCLTGDGTIDLDAVEVVATATDDGFRLDGVARYVDGAAVADDLLVAARTTGGTIHVHVPAASTGVTVRIMHGIDLTRRLGEVRFDSVEVPSPSVVADEKAGASLAARAVDVATVLQAAEAVGGAQHLLATTVQYAKDRVQFGRPIGSFQAIKHRLADLMLEVEAMRAATYDAALALADGSADRAEAVAVAGSFVADAYARVCGEALQLHGGIAFTWEHDVHIFVRRAKVDQVLYGEPAWHRERLCRLVEAGVAAETR